MITEVLVNQIQTPDGTILQSFHRHDYKEYKDTVTGETYMVDGGLDYLRRSAGHLVPYIERSLLNTDPHSLVRLAFRWGTYGPEGKDSKQYVTLSDMSDGHIQACLDNLSLTSKIRKLFLDELFYRKQ